MNIKKFEIFRKGSTTYFFSSIFFPRVVRERVFTLYAFVRTADDFVDQIPQDKASFESFVNLTGSALRGETTGNQIVDDFIKLSKADGFDEVWINDFLASMRADLTVDKYETFEALEKYVYGSADVIGYMMARIMRLPDESLKAAGLLGKSMQLINFIRDISEDLALNRVYMPQDELAKFGLGQKLENAKEETKKFSDFARYQIDRYRHIVQEAEKGFLYIPKRLRTSIMTANDMYKWTADRIYEDPMIVFEKKVKPSPFFIITKYVRNCVKINISK